MKILRFSLLALLALVLVLAGCSKQEAPPPSPSPTPTPPPKVTGNQDCKGSGPNNATCELTVAQIQAESAMPGHSCADFDASSAITVAVVATPPAGQWAGLHVVKSDTDPDFTVTITPCPNQTPPAPAAPFTHMPPTTPGKDWDSGPVNPGVLNQAKYKKYSMTIHLHGAKKGGGAKSKSFDPHIVFGG